LMKIVQINSTCGLGSTGKICVSVSKLLLNKDIENYVFYAFGDSTYTKHIKYMSPLEVKCQAIKAKVFGNYGFQSKVATKRIIYELEQISPDIVHLHNLHSHNVHLGELFTYLKSHRVRVVWTFHDCWAFTAYCPHYDMVGCYQWKTADGCNKCPQKTHYSWLFDRSVCLFEKKKRLFRGLDLTVITPSQWLADQVKQSFLQEVPVKVINNGIDLTVFYPCESGFRDKYNLKEKFIILGVAFEWGCRKGLDVFIRLSQLFDDRFRIVLVGTNESIDKILPSNIISIHRTQNQLELAEIYTAADVFVNPTREENFPTTHIEALACGTPVVSFNTGGCSEMLTEKTGIVVERDDEEALYNAILYIEKERPFIAEDCRKRAEAFENNKKYEEYVSLYKELLK